MYTLIIFLSLIFTRQNYFGENHYQHSVCAKKKGIKAVINKLNMGTGGVLYGTNNYEYDVEYSYLVKCCITLG